MNQEHCDRAGWESVCGQETRRASEAANKSERRSMTRRTFVGWAACLAVGVGAGAVVAGCSAGAPSSDEGGDGDGGQAGVRTIEDMGGRTVSVPFRLDRLFCTNPIGTADLFMLAPEKLIGWSQRPSGEDAKYIPDEYLALPSLGVWRGSGSVPNVEEIAAQNPEVLLCFWTADDVGRSMAEKINGDTGLPVVLVDYSIRQTPQAFRFVGDLIGSAERAEELAKYCEDRLALIERVVQTIPESELKSVYLAQGSDGLETDPVGSMHVTDALELVRTGNVADMPGTKGKGMGMPTANLEQIMEWDPAAALVSEHGTDVAEGSSVFGTIKSDPHWANVPCVEAGEVYRIPQSPFSWFGRPPSAARLLGCLWLLKVLYPRYASSIDMRAETVDFYRTFYRYEGFEDTELDHMLGAAGVDDAADGKPAQK